MAVTQAQTPRTTSSIAAMLTGRLAKGRPILGDHGGRTLESYFKTRGLVQSYTLKDGAPGAKEIRGQAASTSENMGTPAPEPLGLELVSPRSSQARLVLIL
jgi:hypothetical protein